MMHTSENEQASGDEKHMHVNESVRSTARHGTALG